MKDVESGHDALLPIQPEPNPPVTDANTPLVVHAAQSDGTARKWIGRECLNGAANPSLIWRR